MIMKKLFVFLSALLISSSIISCVNFDTSFKGTWTAYDVKSTLDGTPESESALPQKITISDTSINAYIATYINGQGWIFTREILGVTIPCAFENLYDYYLDGNTIYAYTKYDAKGNPIVDFTLQYRNGKLHYHEEWASGRGIADVWLQK